MAFFPSSMQSLPINYFFWPFIFWLIPSGHLSLSSNCSFPKKSGFYINKHFSSVRFWMYHRNPDAFKILSNGEVAGYLFLFWVSTHLFFCISLLLEIYWKFEHLVRYPKLILCCLDLIITDLLLDGLHTTLFLHRNKFKRHKFNISLI